MKQNFISDKLLFDVRYSRIFIEENRLKIVRIRLPVCTHARTALRRASKTSWVGQGARDCPELTVCKLVRNRLHHYRASQLPRDTFLHRRFDVFEQLLETTTDL